MTQYKVRRAIQLVSFIGWIMLLFFIIQGVLPVTHAFCPYASVCFGTMAAHGIVVYPITSIIGLLIAITTMFIGRKFCGYICFLGTLQEYIYRLRKGKSRFIHTIPDRLHRILSVVKYLVLTGTIIAAWFSVQFIYMKFCPVVSLGHPQRITIGGAILLAVIGVGGFFIERFWCRYLCPYGALMNLFQYLGRLLKIKRITIFRNVQNSIQCPNCPNYCPMHIDLGTREYITDPNCIHCMNCVRQCTKDSTRKSTCIYRDNG
ncbi:MAG: 4Fe-4S binding protein [Candidatus Cloacimonetes bacterium]|nr:4Fe-4S binding protein [Candidatus Cloacimonadota bacterium]